ncbi:MAG TPA: hypothetical protein VIL20_02425 [Sandaracinaceae bacterium]
MRNLVPLLLASAAFACTGSHTGEDAGMNCDGVVCDICEDALQIRVLLPEGAPVVDVSVEGVEGVVCEPAAGIIYCGRRDLPPGEYHLTVRADGYHPEPLTFYLGHPSGRECCVCPSIFARTLTLEPIEP